MNLPDFLTQGQYGEIRLTGHRIDLMHVVDRYHEGLTPEMMAFEFDTLSLYEIGRVIDFYEKNRAEVDAYVARCHAEIERQMASTPPGPSLEDLRKRLEAKQRAQGA